MTTEGREQAGGRSEKDLLVVALNAAITYEVITQDEASRVARWVDGMSAAAREQAPTGRYASSEEER